MTSVVAVTPRPTEAEGGVECEQPLDEVGGLGVEVPLGSLTFKISTRLLTEAEGGVGCKQSLDEVGGLGVELPGEGEVLVRVHDALEQLTLSVTGMQVHSE